MIGLSPWVLAAALGLYPADEAPKPPPDWCAPELTTLDDDVCFFRGKPAKEGERVLVVFLHGLVQKGTDWQHNQQRAAVRGAKRAGYSVIAPRGLDDANPKYPGMVAWPTSASAQKAHEDAVLAQWRKARADLKDRGHTFDHVFVVGFSNGAYYGASLALRGAFEADGYAVFAGGGSWGMSAKRRAPIFVGICSRDQTADSARELARVLAHAGWPHEVESRRVGHTMADAHLDHAIEYLRGQVEP